MMKTILMMINLILCSALNEQTKSGFLDVQVPNIEKRIIKIIRSPYSRYRQINYRAVPFSNHPKIVVIGPIPLQPNLPPILRNYKGLIPPVKYSLYNNDYSFNHENQHFLDSLFSSHFGVTDKGKFRPSQPLNELPLQDNFGYHDYQSNYNSGQPSESGLDVISNNDRPTPSPNVEILESIGYSLPPETTYYHPIEYAKEYSFDELPSTESISNHYNNKELIDAEESTDHVESTYRTDYNTSQDDRESHGQKSASKDLLQNRKPITFEESPDDGNQEEEIEDENVSDNKSN